VEEFTQHKIKDLLPEGCFLHWENQSDILIILQILTKIIIYLY
jgi:hypothetical protein